MLRSETLLSKHWHLCLHMGAGHVIVGACACIVCNMFTQYTHYVTSSVLLSMNKSALSIFASLSVPINKGWSF